MGGLGIGDCGLEQDNLGKNGGWVLLGWRISQTLKPKALTGDISSVN